MNWNKNEWEKEPMSHNSPQSHSTIGEKLYMPTLDIYHFRNRRQTFKNDF